MEDGDIERELRLIEQRARDRMGRDELDKGE
jgi:hypothetical protein